MPDHGVSQSDLDHADMHLIIAGLVATFGVSDFHDLPAAAAKLVQRNTELQRRFDVEWNRLREATNLWRAEAPDERLLIQPALDALLDWLMARHRGLQTTMTAIVEGLGAANAEEVLAKIEQINKERRA